MEFSNFELRKYHLGYVRCFECSHIDEIDSYENFCNRKRNKDKIHYTRQWRKCLFFKLKDGIEIKEFYLNGF